MEDIRHKRVENFNWRHRAKDLPPLDIGDNVWIRDLDRDAEVISHYNNRSYRLNTPVGTVLRNRTALVHTPEDSSLQMEEQGPIHEQHPTPGSSAKVPVTTTPKECRSLRGTLVSRPKYLIEEM